MAKKSKGSASSRPAKLPKAKCCLSEERCRRCPIRMLQEGSLPAGYTVKRRRLVKLDAAPDARPVEATPKKKSKKRLAA